MASMNISLRQLEAFRQVMRFGSVSEAARAINRAQPSVSSMIRNLERELGFALFERRKSRMIPTPEAHYFLEESEVVLDRLDQSKRTMRQIGDIRKGTLKIACLPVASDFFLPREVVKFTRDKPDVSISLMMRSSAIVEELVASQQFDIGLAETPNERGTLKIDTFEYECVCAIRSDDPLATEAKISPRNLSGRPLAMLAQDHPMHRMIKKTFEQANCEMFQRFELQTELPALELVENNVCCAIVNRICAESYRIFHAGKSRIIFKPFSPAITSSMSVLTPAQRPQSLLAAAFYDQLVATLSSLRDAY